MGEVEIFGAQVIAAGVVITVAVIIGLILVRSDEDDRGSGALWSGAVPTVLPPLGESAPTPIPIQPSATPSRSSAPATTKPPTRRVTHPARTTPPPPPLAPAPGTRASLAADGLLMRHRDFVVRLEAPGTSDTAKQDATFILRAGLARAGCLSLEAVNFPGRFVRHRDFVLRLETRADSPLYREDATFCPERSGDAVVLRAVNYPDRVVSVGRDGLLVLPPPAGSTPARLTFGRPAPKINPTLLLPSFGN